MATNPSRSAKAAARSGKSVLHPKAPIAPSFRLVQKVEDRLRPRDRERVQMQEHEVDPVPPQPPPRRVHPRAQTGGIELLPHELPRRRVDRDPELRRDPHFRMLRERPPEQRLGVAGSVGLRGIEEADPRGHSLADRGDRNSVVGLAPADGVVPGEERPPDRPRPEPEARECSPRSRSSGSWDPPRLSLTVPDRCPCGPSVQPSRHLRLPPVCWRIGEDEFGRRYLIVGAIWLLRRWSALGASGHLRHR